MRHPIQPLELDSQGMLRFKENAIIRFLYETGRFNLNELALMPFDENDVEQFYQLLGTSLQLYADYEFISDETYDMAKWKYDNPTFCATCGKQTNGEKFCSKECSEYEDLE